MSRWDVFVWLLAPAAVPVAVAATAVCVLKRRWVWAAVSLAATAVAVYVAASAPGASSEAFEDLALAAVYLFVVVPATLVAVIGATRPGRPGSWWARRIARPSGS